MVKRIIMEPPSRTVDYARLVDIAQALGHALGLQPIAPDALDQCLHTVLAERSLVEAVHMHLITEREASGALLDRVMTWMLRTQSRSHSMLTDYSSFEAQARGALFGNADPATADSRHVAD